MDEKFKREVIARLDEAYRRAGAAGYDDAFALTVRLFEGLLPIIRQMDTREKLMALMDKVPELRKRERWYLLFTAKFLPGLIRSGANRLAADLRRDFPALPGGRPAKLMPRQKTAVIDYVAHLHKSLPLPIAKKRASQRFHTSVRTIDRVWTNRIKDKSPVTSREVIAWLSH